MRIHHTILLLLSAASTVFSAAACSGGASLDCATFCEKSVMCQASSTLDKCNTQCAAINEVADSSYLSQISACIDGACDQLSACAQTAVTTCTNDVDGYYQDYCVKFASCDKSVTVEACMALKDTPDVQKGLVFMKCINDATLSQLNACIQAADCADFEKAAGKCSEDILSKFDG